MQRYPVNAGRLHRHRANTTLLQPVCYRVEISRERWESAHRLRIAIGWNGYEYFAGSNIYSGGIRVQNSQVLNSLFRFVLMSPPEVPVGRPRYEFKQTPNRDRCREANVITKLYATLDPRLP